MAKQASQQNPLRRLTDTLNPGETLLITSTHHPQVGRLTRHASSFDVTIHTDTEEDAEVLDSGHFLTLQSALDFLDSAFDTQAG
ncbi:MAG: hypothetical protein MJ060_04605, partial [Clostridia bacterium]|nr:hypothetical protein [Clostridia bacterium]